MTFMPSDLWLELRIWIARQALRRARVGTQHHLDCIYVLMTLKASRRKRVELWIDARRANR